MVNTRCSSAGHLKERRRPPQIFIVLSAILIAACHILTLPGLQGDSKLLIKVGTSGSDGWICLLSCGSLQCQRTDVGLRRHMHNVQPDIKLPASG